MDAGTGILSERAGRPLSGEKTAHRRLSEKNSVRYKNVILRMLRPLSEAGLEVTPRKIGEKEIEFLLDHYKHLDTDTQKWMFNILNGWLKFKKNFVYEEMMVFLAIGDEDEHRLAVPGGSARHAGNCSRGRAHSNTPGAAAMVQAVRGPARADKGRVRAQGPGIRPGLSSGRDDKRKRERARWRKMEDCRMGAGHPGRGGILQHAPGGDGGKSEAVSQHELEDRKESEAKRAVRGTGGMGDKPERKDGQRVLGERDRQHGDRRSEEGRHPAEDREPHPEKDRSQARLLRGRPDSRDNGDTWPYFGEADHEVSRADRQRGGEGAAKSVRLPSRGKEKNRPKKGREIDGCWTGGPDVEKGTVQLNSVQLCTGKMRYMPDQEVGALGFEPRSAGFHYAGSDPARIKGSLLQLVITGQQTLCSHSL